VHVNVGLIRGVTLMRKSLDFREMILLYIAVLPAFIIVNVYNLFYLLKRIVDVCEYVYVQAEWSE